MDDTKLDEIIRQALSESREPPAPPLDEMWAHVEREHFDRTVVLPLRSRAPVRWGLTLLPAAAALVFGVALGRYSAPHDSAIVTRATAPIATTRGDTGMAGIDRTAAQPPVKAPIQSPDVPSAPPSSRAAAIPVQLAARGGDDAYRDEMSRYLARTAALLATLPANGRSAESDADVADRAGTLLTQTHLLLDSRVGSDPTLHKLLEDLELVLAQVARLHPVRSTTDLQLIHEALQQRDVLPRLHDAAVEAESND